MIKMFFLTLLTFLTTFNVLANSIRVQCRGHGASSDRLIYEVIFNSNICENGGTFDLHADGHGPGGQDDIDNRFQSVEYHSHLNKDDRGRALSVQINGDLLPDGHRGRSVNLSLDLGRPNTQSEIEFMRKDGELVFATISCNTTLPQVCQQVTKCRRSCHPRAGCERFCWQETVCSPGKFASED